MNTPITKEQLIKKLNVTSGQACLILTLLNGVSDPEAFYSVSAWISQCYSRPSDVDMVMMAINQVMKGHGVEGILSEDGLKCHASYVNTGDSYSPTILYCFASKNYLLTSWGDFVESNGLD